MSRKAGKFEWNMVELPDGITTSNGNWYHTTSEEIQRYIPGLLKKHDLEKIVKNADYWVSSCNGMSLILYLVLVLLSLNPFLSGVICLTFFLFWYYNTSAFVTPVLNSVARLFHFDGFLYVATAASLIYLSMQGNESATWVGLALFFMFKVGLLKMLLSWISVKTNKNKAPRQDRILNMLLVRYGIKEGLYSGNIQNMQDSLFKTINYHKTRNKNK
ncbi:MAG TPA: hypothetical protein DEO59_07250 [Balneola sp.]|jgi:hypothetical protein|nr:hypothetical protein [Balneola sp.]MAO78957.1 hypothetical protein [Balneola sp.]MBF63616.1 hypothetical protein [Balneola sp.]HAW79622.1 hypothetical protein [Balneola sp.]HBZ38274.1 hypothetical protein [Balneola sp.]|tara:strand:+ start:3503 stop:4150 length:648 start_codon:yes stop_codon:yes gene_type:complete